MTVTVDFLPSSYRAKARAKRSRREMGWFLFVVVCATVVTDVVLRKRVAGVHRMERLAAADVELLKQRVDGTARVADEVSELRREITSLLAQAGTVGMSRVLDELFADRPAGVRLHEFECRLGGASESTIELRLNTSCEELGDLSQYLAAISARGVLPRLHFKRTQQRREDGVQGFRLESDGAVAR